MGMEYLVDVLKIDPGRLYATVFEGYAPEGLERDTKLQPSGDSFYRRTASSTATKKTTSGKWVTLAQRPLLGNTH